MGKDGRGLDHLMEQNETELDFLSAYGGVDDGQKGDGHALLSALQRFCGPAGSRPTSTIQPLILRGVCPGRGRRMPFGRVRRAPSVGGQRPHGRRFFRWPSQRLNAVKSACC